MSDLFTRLAERAVGIAPIVQPMIAPLYATEPLQGDEQSSLELAVEQDAGDARKRSSLSAPVSQEQALPPVPSLAQTCAEQSAARSQSAPHPAEETLIGQPAIERVIEQSAPVQQNQPSLPILPEKLSTVGQVGGEEIHILVDTEQSFVERHPRQVGHEVTTFPIATPSPEQTTRRVTQVSLPEEREPEHTTPVAMPALPEVRRTISVQHALLPVQQSVERERIHTVRIEKQRPDEMNVPVPTPEVLAPAPTVHVTIGRIEVRAAQTPLPTAQQQQKKNTPVVMSLDDYLHQRAKGERA